MSDNQAIVRDFIGAFNANDVERVMSFFTDDAVYHNIPVAPVSGPDAIRGVLTGFMGMASEIDWVLHNISENAEGVVLTERNDRFLVGEKWVELPVMGAFDLRDGKISSWRDYFDMNQFQSQLAG
jgi:limonene-1,2-epoxide hydrolase